MFTSRKIPQELSLEGDILREIHAIIEMTATHKQKVTLIKMVIGNWHHKVKTKWINAYKELNK